MAVGAFSGFQTRIGDTGGTVRPVWSAPAGSSWLGPFIESGDRPTLTVDPGGEAERTFTGAPASAPAVIAGGVLAWDFTLTLDDGPAGVPEAGVVHTGEAVRLSIAAGAVEDSVFNTTGGASDAGVFNGSGRGWPPEPRGSRGRGWRGRPGAWG